MPSFDIVSKTDLQKLDNAINTASKEIVTRFDFNHSKTTIELDKKTMEIHVLTENDMRMKTVEGIIISRMVKQGLDTQSLDFGKEVQTSIMDEQVRVTGKKIDDLQEIIALMEKSPVGIPLQFDNYR